MKDFPERIDRTSRDPLLSLMLRLLPKAVQSFGLTIVVDGVIASGLAVDRDEWIEEWLTVMNTAGPAGQALEKAFRFSIEDQGGAFGIAGDLSGVDQTQYVHLKNAKLYTGSAQYGPTLFRARLSQVGGWTMGEFNSLN